MGDLGSSLGSAQMPHRSVLVGSQALPGVLTLPAGAQALVVFAHGSGSSRLSLRNRRVAESLQLHGLGTLLFDLLHEREAQQRERVFDIALLADRLLQAVAWVSARADLALLRIGLFGASTGAAAALSAAAEQPRRIGAVVSRGGRPDLAAAALPRVQAPTLLIVGAHDPEVLALNREALQLLSCEKRLEIVPRATHLFEEAGALERVAALAGDWFATHLAFAGQP
jgi:dienelactone hydrolase